MSERTLAPDARTVGILIFDGVEPLDFVGPYEVFAIARRDGERPDASAPFRPLTLAAGPGLVRAIGGLKVEPDATLAEAPALDVLVVPGGRGILRVVEQPDVIGWIRARAGAGALATSVCTGAYALASAGLLAGRRATTHWAALPRFPELHPDVELVADARFVDEGDVITSAGVSAGIDMALHVVARLLHPEAARWTARLMEYDSLPDSMTAAPSSARSDDVSGKDLAS